jgi:hypothetical protein
MPWPLGRVSFKKLGYKPMALDAHRSQKHHLTTEGQSLQIDTADKPLTKAQFKTHPKGEI